MAVRNKTANKETFTSVLACQRCTNPLKLDFSLKDIDNDIFHELRDYAYVRPGFDDRNELLHILNKKLESSAMKKIMVPAHISEEASDFMVIGELASLPFENIPSLKIAETLLDLTSDHSTIDHPLCEECTDQIHDQMDSQLIAVKNESNLYEHFLDQHYHDLLSAENDNDNESLEGLQAQLRECQKEEALLEAQLNKLEAKQKSTKKIFKSYEEENANIEKEEKKLWKEYCGIKYKILFAEDGERSVNNQLLSAQSKLNKLINNNVFNTTFHIWHCGHFGTINNFRLGRLTNENVPWNEINAAWGQTVLLLHSLATKIDLTFKRYRLVPYGSHSHLVPLYSKHKHLPLYCFGGLSYVLDNRFDDAMVAFLDCLQQLNEEIHTSDETFKLPYKMEKGKIEEKKGGKSYSIKIDLNSHEQWTKALKFMLTNLTWAVSWVSTHVQ